MEKDVPIAVTDKCHHGAIVFTTKSQVAAIALGVDRDKVRARGKRGVASLIPYKRHWDFPAWDSRAVVAVRVDRAAVAVKVVRVAVVRAAKVVKAAVGVVRAVRVIMVVRAGMVKMAFLSVAHVDFLIMRGAELRCAATLRLRSGR